MTNLHSTTPTDLTPTAVRDLFNATKGRQDIQSDLMDGLSDRMQAVEAIFTHSTEESRTLTDAEGIARLHHRLDMTGGEITALWRALEKLEGTLATINQLIAPGRQHIAWKDRRTDGASPFQADPE